MADPNTDPPTAGGPPTVGVYHKSDAPSDHQVDTHAKPGVPGWLKAVLALVVVALIILAVLALT